MKNAVLKKNGQQLCVNKESAYMKDYVPVFTSINMKQNSIVSHARFDIGNSSISCKKKIETRLSALKQALYQPPPIKWTNVEFIAPVLTLFILFVTLTISLLVNYLFCSGRIKRTGPRRQEILMGNRD